MNWQKRLADRLKSYDHEPVQDGILFAPARFWYKDSSGENKSGYLYKPTMRRTYDVWNHWLEISDNAAAEKEAPLLRMSLIDENIPLEIDLIGNCGGITRGGRIWNAYSLGEIMYHEALPELCEAAEHDLNVNMRESCVDAIGMMGSPARRYSSVVAQRLANDKDLFVRKTAAKVLGDIGTKKDAKTLREVIEEIRETVKCCEDLGYEDTSNKNSWHTLVDYSLLFEFSLISLFKLDHRQGMEELTKSLQHVSSFIHHHAKNARFFAGESEVIKHAKNMRKANKYLSQK